MNMRKASLILITILIASITFVSVVQALGNEEEAPTAVAALVNVRDYAPAVTVDGLNYAVDGGQLFVGKTGAWMPVTTPAGVIVNTVTQDSRLADVIYMGAANELSIFRSTDGGQNWLRIPLSEQAGAITDIAVDSAGRMVYVGTDTAGLFRLRDVGSSLIDGGRLSLDEPVLQVEMDTTGSGLVFARTAWNLYRAENGGIEWTQVDNLNSVPTALAIANTTPATVYVGTADRGVLASSDGLTWQTANAGLGMTPGSRLFVDALAVDPIQPEVVYVSTSFLFGSANTHATSQGVAMSTDRALAWNNLAPALDGNVAVAELLPVSGQPGAVFALAINSRTPIALGTAPTVPTLALAAAVQPAPAEAVTELATESVTEPVTEPVMAAQTATPSLNADWLAWMVAGLAALALAFTAGYDMWRRWGRKPLAGHPTPVRVGHK